MRKIYKITIISLCLVLVLSALAVLAGTIYIARFSDKNIDYAHDEMLFSLAKGGTDTEYYANTAIGDEYDFEAIESIVLGDKRKLWVSISEVDSDIINSFISAEDRKFYSHSGVDLKRTLYALFNSVFHIKNTFGASTITQQVIKNISGDNEITIKRKFAEIIRAYNIEKNHSKDEILELYLNIVPMGENLYGVGAAAEWYFGKDVGNLSLSEAATLVGITNAPTRYNPHKNPEECLHKRNDVLFAMYSFDMISEEEYLNAKGEPLSVLPIPEEQNSVSWFIETVNSDVISALEKEYGISRSAAETLLYNGGLKIYTTENPIIQRKLEEYFENKENFPAQIETGLDYSMVICDSQNGNLLGIVGSVGKKRADKLLNLGIVPQTPGSSLKPLALYAPLIDMGKINWASVFDDVPLEFNKSGGYYTEYPQNYPKVYDGLTTVKDALKLSKNTVAVRLYEMLGAEETYRNLKNDFGFDTLIRRKETESGILTDLASSPLALGQLSYGVSLRKLTEAYTVFPSDGVLTEGRSFIYVYDKEGKLLIDNSPKEKRIFKKETARIMNKLLMNVTDSGTASAVTLKYKIDTAGKTGTSGEDRDRLFIGYTPYLTAGIWCGYRDSDKAIGRVSVSHVKVWDNIMNVIHDELLSKEIDEDIKSFSVSGLKKYEYCKDSGKLYCQDCMYDPRGSRLEYGYFTADNRPHGMCDRHILCKYDFLGDGVANDCCPEEYITLVSLLKINERHFPKEVIVTDAEYVYYDTDGSCPLGDNYDIPYFKYYIDDGMYIGIGRRKRQFNCNCNLHGEEN